MAEAQEGITLLSALKDLIEDFSCIAFAPAQAEVQPTFSPLETDNFMPQTQRAEL